MQTHHSTTTLSNNTGSRAKRTFCENIVPVTRIAVDDLAFVRQIHVLAGESLFYVGEFAAIAFVGPGELAKPPDQRKS